MFIIKKTNIMKKAFRQMWLPLLVMLAILVWVAINNFSDWVYWQYALYSVLLVGTLLLSFFCGIEDTKSKIKSLEQIFSFVLVTSFVFCISFIFIGTIIEIRLMVTILLCAVVILQILELLQTPPKKCSKAVYFADAMIAMVALIAVCSYFDNSETIIALLWMMMCVFAVAMFVSLIGYGVKWLWSKLKR